MSDKPLIDRDALTDAFMAKRAEAGGCSEGPECSACYRLAGEEADVALKLARPMPTQEDLALWLQETFTADAGGTSWELAAECLLICLRGEA